MKYYVIFRIDHTAPKVLSPLYIVEHEEIAKDLCKHGEGQILYKEFDTEKD